MKPFAHEVTQQAIATLAKRRGVPFEATDAIWITHALIETLQPLCLPNATTEQFAMWFTDWLPEIEEKLRAS